MGQDGLNDLAFLSVEREKFEMINFNNIRVNFLHRKQWKIINCN